MISNDIDWESLINYVTLATLAENKQTKNNKTKQMREWSIRITSYFGNVKENWHLIILYACSAMLMNLGAVFIVLKTSD